MTLKGFKSFASATTLLLEEGITCVVGPNGSGKSNVVDALSWVLGEQGAKSLRGGKMEDVIFAGTAGRAPLGRAEVSVTIDNSDGALPIEFSEVTITRILFRNGTSEYQLNGETTRLLDIQELLSDSGIGREMHVIVGQGQLDAILLANPEERRAFIEEAAGVLKHRKRKEKALRKLDSMQGNLARIQDLTVELRRQLKPLGKQAEVARKASIIQSDARDAKLRILADDLISMRSAIAVEVADENSLRATRDAVEVELNTSRSREIELDDASIQENPLLVAAQENFYRLSALREKFRGIQSLSSERARFLSQEREEARANGRDPESMDLEAVVLRGEEEAAIARAKEAADVLNTLSLELKESEDALANAQNFFATAERAVADQREGSARQEGHINALRARINATEAELTRLDQARSDATLRLSASRTTFATLESEIAGVDRFEPELDSVYEKAKSVLDAASGKCATLLEAEQSAGKVRAGLVARLAALEESLLHRDGGAAILEGRGGTVSRGRLSTLINVESGWEAAVAAALGTLSESIVVSDLSSAVHAIGMLKSESAGRSELLVMHASDMPVAVMRDGLKPLASLITSTRVDGLDAIVQSLLSTMVAASTLDEARSIVDAHPGLTAVTRDGDLISRQRVRGGSTETNNAIAISSLIEKSRSELESTITTCDRLKFELAQAQNELEIAKKEHDAALAGLNESDAKISGLAEQMAVAGQNVKSAQAELDRLAALIAAATDQKVNDESELAVALTQFESAVPPAQPDSAPVLELQGKVAALRARQVDFRLELRTLEERSAAIGARASELENTAKRERENAAQGIVRSKQRAIAAQLAQEIADLAYEALIQIEATISKAHTERKRLEASRAEREGETLSIRARIRELATELDQLTSSVHQDEIVRAEQRMRIEQLELRAVEELGIDVDTLVSEYGPENDVPTLVEDGEGNFAPGDLIPYRRDQQEKRLAQAERGLAMLGKINPLALEEYNAHEERLRYLAEQLEDLKKTKKDLLDIIKEVDEKVIEIFEEAYRDTEREFRAIFARLFPGGEGRLILTDPSNMAISGVDVEARPPGKRVKRLSLLSGGERSLVAVAMLVAIFKARPSPFYVMDEVEAALDDANLSRLLGVFDELREKSQLIIITHQKRTMEIADALYGITMRGDGVSEVISQRIRESESV